MAFPDAIRSLDLLTNCFREAFNQAELVLSLE
jgi:hypothetical protein